MRAWIQWLTKNYSLKHGVPKQPNDAQSIIRRFLTHVTRPSIHNIHKFQRIFALLKESPIPIHLTFKVEIRATVDCVEFSFLFKFFRENRFNLTKNLKQLYLNEIAHEKWIHIWYWIEKQFLICKNFGKKSGRIFLINNWNKIKKIQTIS